MLSNRYLSAPIPGDEKDRLSALYHLKILDTPAEERFDKITSLAVSLFRVPISTITLIDSQREWFKSCQGLSGREGKRAISFCGHAILSQDILMINDTRKDTRFAHNPLVMGKPFIRFYAGVPIFSASGQRVGVFCIKDRIPRRLNSKQRDNLKALASWAELELNVHELSLAIETRRKAERKISQLNDVLHLLNKILRHDILNDLTVIKTNIELFIKYPHKIAFIEHTQAIVDRSVKLVHQMKQVESTISVGNAYKIYSVEKVVKEVINLFPSMKIRIVGNGKIIADEAIYSIFENMIRNVEQHSGVTSLDIKIREKNHQVEIYVADKGIGIPQKLKEKLFSEGFYYGKTGHTGLGLYIIKKTIDRYRGEIRLQKNNPRGVVFIIRLQKAN